ECAGDLGCLPDFLESLSPGFLNEVIAPAAAPDAARWRALMRRGGFRELAWFAAEALSRMRKPVRAVFVEVMSEEVSAMVAAADWGALAQGVSNTARIVDVSVRTILQSAW